MKKGYYIQTKYESNDQNTNLGVDIKIQTQMQEMRKNKMEVALLDRILLKSNKQN